MEPQIRYVKTGDGVNIAYAVVGDGPPIMFVSTMFGALHMASHSALFRQPVDQLVARGWRVILYDQRGSGSSDRDCDDFSLEARLQDLQAVIDGAAPGERYVLLASLTAGSVGIAHAASLPDRVSHLVLRNAFADGSTRQDSMLGLVVARALRPVLQDQWEFFALTLAHAMGGYEKSDQAREFAEAYRTGMAPQTYLAASEEVDRIDVTDLLASIQVPCLVVNDTGYLSVGRGWGPEARNLASRIPNARLVVTDDFPRAMDDFLRGTIRFDVGPDAATPTQSTGGLQTIVFTDIEANTELLQRLGDERWRALLREHETIIRAELARHGGAEIKTMGDAFMASFGSAAGALECAVSLQRAFAEHNTAAEHPLRVRIGVNAGEPIAEADDLFGTSVTMTSRIMGHAKGGEVLVSDVVRQLVAGKGFLFADRGESLLRGFEDPVRLWQLRLEDGR